MHCSTASFKLANTSFEVDQEMLSAIELLKGYINAKLYTYPFKRAALVSLHTLHNTNIIMTKTRRPTAAATKICQISICGGNAFSVISGSASVVTCIEITASVTQSSVTTPN